jgi:hypothetical protein
MLARTGSRRKSRSQGGGLHRTQVAIYCWTRSLACCSVGWGGRCSGRLEFAWVRLDLTSETGYAILEILNVKVGERSEFS